MRFALRLLAVIAAAGVAAGCAEDRPTQPGSSAHPAGRPGASASAPPAGRASQPVRLRPAASPERLAARLSAAERTVRDPHTPDAEVAAAAFEMQLLYRQLGRRPDWQPRVIGALPAAYRAEAGAQVTARRALGSMRQTRSAKLPAWQIVAPAPADDLRRFYLDGQRRFRIPWQTLAAVNLIESGMGRIRGTSTAGAQGPMQFMPSTWARFGRGDIDDPHAAILAAARFLAANGGARRIDAALYRYNNHPAYVAAVKAYASVLANDPRMFRAFYDWQVVYLSAIGDIWLPVGFHRRTPIKVTTYVARHPAHRLNAATH